MSNVLFLAHRLPYPPNKGDKVRSYHLLKHLASRHRVFLGTFYDDAEDERYVDVVRALCADVLALPLNPRVARVRSLQGLASGQALTLPYYRDSRLATWVENTLQRQRIDTAVVFSSAMAQYLTGPSTLRTLVDFVDVDSAKWMQYAARQGWPLSWLYRREGQKLLAFERATSARASSSLFVTEAEADLFRGLAPECAAKTHAVSNGVDTHYYSPGPEHHTPFAKSDLPIVFTGAMDYWPNIDAVRWFATEVMPRLRARWPRAAFYIVGMRPAASVLALAGEGIFVTGTVADVRPYLRHASVVVAPMRIARGIQNKVLEAMAMARPVVASQACTSVIDAVAGRELESAADAGEFIERIDALLRDPSRGEAMGQAARAYVERNYSWTAHSSAIDRHFDGALDEIANAA